MKRAKEPAKKSMEVSKAEAPKLKDKLSKKPEKLPTEPPKAKDPLKAKDNVNPSRGKESPKEAPLPKPKDSPPVKHRESVAVIEEMASNATAAGGMMETPEDAVLNLVEYILRETMDAVPHHERIGRCIHFAVDAMSTLVYATLHMGCDIVYDDELSWIGSPEPEVAAGPIDRYAVLSLPHKEASARTPKHYTHAGDGTRSLSRTHSEKSMSRAGKRPLPIAAGSTPPVEISTAPPKEVPLVTRVHYPSEIMTEERRRWRQECMDKLSVTAQAKSRWNRVTLVRRVISSIQSDPECITESHPSTVELPSPMTLETTAIATVLGRNQPDDTSSLYIPTARDGAASVLDDASVKADEPPAVKVVTRYTKGYNRFHRVTTLEPSTKKPPKAANWFFDRSATDHELKESDRAYEPLMSEFQRDKFPQCIELNPGVTLIHGVSVYSGPHRQESPQSMSRKGFRKHLSLPQSGPNKVKLTSLSSASPTFSEFNELDQSPGASPRSEFSLHNTTTPRRNSLSEANSTVNRPSLASPELVKPRPAKTPLHQHSPAIRVRVSPMKADTPNARPSAREQYVTHGDSVGVPDIPKKRPATALGALLSLTPPISTGKRSAKSKYLREFPKPKPEVVTVLKDEPQRLAWLG
ncbi:hypothetical protein ACHHYP_04768 [Achlya hypogyna]|uniref:Uncharacterized protein n=1 Tax=Achlya hypogyna TaxID=1202772 RepID=A0A1V9Z0E7_ACHHY|nr:hypothetical protein ACHHYP_04768 [Achlya hypogyna]